MFNTVEKVGKNIKISGVHIPRGLPIQIMPRWSRGIKEGMRIEAVNVSGNIYLQNKEFCPAPPFFDTAVNLKGGIIGNVTTYDQARKEIGSTVVSLGKYKILDQVKHVQDTIEIVPSPKDVDKLQVIERRMLTRGLSDDASAHIYTISAKARDAQKEMALGEAIPDLGWIRDVSIEGKNGKYVAVISYSRPDGTNDTFELDGSSFRDNFGKELLANRRSDISSLEDIYQSDFYSPETIHYRPRIDVFNGNVRLILHKVARYDIDMPKGLEIKDGQHVKIHPSTASAAINVKIGDDYIWIPLTTDRPLTRKDLLSLGPDGFSRIQAGMIKSAIGPQTRVGNEKNMSLDYPRDPYFYGLPIRAPFHIREKYGDNFGINRGKSLRAQRGIQSGRTHMMPWELLYDELFADIMETNSEYGRKLSNYAHWLWGPGVSEDTQMEVAAWLLGVRMYVIKEMVAFMSAEKAWGNYNVQNTNRYNLSEALFVIPFKLIMKDVFHGKFLERLPSLASWKAVAEIAAGRTWYKWAVGKLFELGAIPVFLSLLGRALWFPVDLMYYMIAWGFRTIASSGAYLLQLTSIGYGSQQKAKPFETAGETIVKKWRNFKDFFRTGFFKNVAFELSYIHGYTTGAMTQHIRHNQFGTFVTTVSGGKGKVPKANYNFISTFGALTGTALFVTGLSLAIGGLSQLIALTGIAIIANVFFGIIGIIVINLSLRHMLRERADNAPQKTMSDFNTDFPTFFNRYNRISREIFDHAQKTHILSYNDLFRNIATLRDILKQLGSMDKAGRIDTGYLNPWRNISNAVIELHTLAEMLICTQCVRELKADPDCTDARLALKKLLNETREFIVIEMAAKMHRRLKP